MPNEIERASPVQLANRKGRTVTERELIPDSHQAMLNAIIDKAPKTRIDPDTADSYDYVDWIVRFNEELRILKTSEDETAIFRAIHQIRYLATQALLAHVRKDFANMKEAG